MLNVFQRLCNYFGAYRIGSMPDTPNTFRYTMSLSGHAPHEQRFVTCGRLACKINNYLEKQNWN